MTERPDDSSPADEPVGLRLFAESGGEGAASLARDGEDEFEALDGQEVDAGTPLDELPDELLALAEQLATEARELSRTYPARTPDRLPVGETAIVATSETPQSTGERLFDRSRESVSNDSSSRRRVGLGVAAAIGFVAIVGSAAYFGADDSSRRTTGQVAAPIMRSVPSATDTAVDSTPAISVRTVSLSLADDGDYRRLEGLLRDRSEPEREALFDLLKERSGEGNGEATAVRISF